MSFKSREGRGHAGVSLSSSENLEILRLVGRGWSLLRSALCSAGRQFTPCGCLYKSLSAGGGLRAVAEV